MLKKLMCWFKGTHCDWETTHSYTYMRQIRGIYGHVHVPQIHVRVCYQTCGKCGETRVQEQVIID